MTDASYSKVLRVILLLVDFIPGLYRQANARFA